MADSTALVGTARVGQAQVGSLGDVVPPYLRASGGCWKRITDPEIVKAAQDAKDYADAQDQTVLDQAASAAQDKADAAQAEAVRLAELAATEADEALEAALGELVADKSNVFIQDVAPVAEMQKTGVLWIDTTPVMVDGAQVPGNIPKTWSGAAWVAITDSAVVQASAEAAAAHQAAQDAADAAGEAMAEARYAPRIAQRPPVQADGVDKPVGAGWLEYAETTNYQGLVADRLVQQWMWSGSAWVRLDMDPTIIPVLQIGTGTFGDLTGDRITVTGTLAAALAEIIELSVEHLTVVEGATISEAVAIAISGATLDYQEAYLHNLRVDGTATIDEAVIGALAANIITSGLFRTADSGQRLEIDSNGLVMYGVDPEGVDYEMVRLGPSGENLLTVGSSTISEMGVAAPHGSFDELQVAGQSVEDLLGSTARGIIGIHNGVGISQWDGSGNEVRRLEVNAQMETGRQYRVSYNTHYIQSRSALPGRLTEFLRWKNIDDGLGVGPASPQLTSAIHWVQQSGWVAVPGGEALLQVPTTGRYQFMLFAKAVAGKDFRYNSESSSPLRMVVEDIGPAVPAVTGYSWFHIGTPSEGSATPPPTPAPQEKRYTGVIWSPSGYGGDLSSGQIVQGYYSGQGNRSGSWTMPGAMRTALQGSTIEKLEIELHNAHWWWGSGGTASLRATDGSGWKAFVGSAHTVPGWPRYQKRWVTIPASWYPYFQSGAWKGIGVHTTSTSNIYYGRWHPGGVRFKATYRK